MDRLTDERLAGIERYVLLHSTTGLPMRDIEDLFVEVRRAREAEELLQAALSGEALLAMCAEARRAALAEAARMCESWTVSPAEWSVETHCPCCGASLSVQYGDDPGEIGVLGTAAPVSEAPLRCCRCGREAPDDPRAALAARCICPACALADAPGTEAPRGRLCCELSVQFCHDAKTVIIAESLVTCAQVTLVECPSPEDAERVKTDLTAYAKGLRP